MSKRPAEDEEWLPNAKEKTAVTKKARSGNEAQGGAAQDKQSDALLKQIKSKTMQAIKRVGHSGKNKPTSTVSFGIPSKDAGIAVMKGFGKITSSNKKTEKRMLYQDEVGAWLGFSKVEGCKFTGRSWCFGGASSGIKVDAAIEHIDVKIEENMITLKAKTYYAPCYM